jgi:hypothetical protein
MPLLAKLNDDAVLCGYSNCRGLLGRIQRVANAKRVEDAAGGWALLLDDGHYFRFSLPDIFVSRGNGFYEEPEQRGRMRRSGLASTHRTTRLSRESADAPQSDLPRASFDAHDLPIRVRCPRRGCGWISTIVPEILDPERHSALDSR